MTLHPHLIHGLRIDSPVSLPAVRRTDPSYAHFRLVSSSGNRRARGTLVAETSNTPFHRTYRVLNDRSSWFVEFDGTGTFEIDTTDQSIHVAPAHQSVSDLTMAALVAGPVAVTAALACEHPVLHASAVVDSAGDAVAFFGPPGRGKTSLATLLVQRGYRLVSDDAVFVEDTPRGHRIWPGTQSLRLRHTSPLIAGHLDRSHDGRTLLPPEDVAEGPATLKALIEPILMPIDGPARYEQAAGGVAMMALQSAIPLAGTSGELLARHFDVTSVIAASVPVIRLVLPWRSGDDAAAFGHVVAEVTRRILAEFADTVPASVMP